MKSPATLPLSTLTYERYRASVLTQYLSLPLSSFIKTRGTSSYHTTVKPTPYAISLRSHLPLAVDVAVHDTRWSFLTSVGSRLPFFLFSVDRSTNGGWIGRGSAPFSRPSKIHRTRFEMIARD